MKKQGMLPTLIDHVYFCLPESVGWYQQFPSHSVYRQAGLQNNFSLHLITSGKGYVETDHETHTLTVGDAFLYFPMQRQRYYSSKDDPWDVRWVHFYGSKVGDYLLERGLHQSNLWTTRQLKPLEQALHELLLEVEESTLAHLTKLSTLTYAVIAEFVNQAIPLSTQKQAATSELIWQLLPRIQQEACKPFELDYWSQEAGVSTYYFCKLFRKVTQMTPMTYVTLCRLQKAKQWLLEKKDTAIRQISLDAGYPSISYFNKRFLEQEGMTPSEYRSQWSQSPSPPSL